MSYSQQRDRELVNLEEKNLNTQLSVCKKVMEMLQTKGWRDIVEPIIDRMIIDVVGGKIGDVWVSGRLDRAKKEERREFHIGYKQALIDLHSRIKLHSQQLPIIEDRIKALQDNKKERFYIPMQETTKYKPED